MLRIKEGVNMTGLKPEMTPVMMVAEAVYSDKQGTDAVITSAVDSKHGDHSLHYKGYALDFRIRNLYYALKNPKKMFGPEHKNLCELVAKEMQVALGEQYQVILEFKKLHIHVEFDPRQLPGN